MELILQIGIFSLSIAALLWSSDKFVSAAERIGLSWGISPFIIGVTIVAFGTSLPELATSIAAVIGGESDIVIGNIVGSNITNIALVLGLTAIAVRTIELEYNLWHIDVPFLIFSAFFLYFIVGDGHVSLFETTLCLFGISIFLAYSFKDQERAGQEDRPKSSLTDYLWLLAGGALVSFSSTFIIDSISQIATALNIAPNVIALTAVALGTSLPEVAVSLNAARRGKAGIAVGNALGSNIFNTFIVLGIPRLFGPLEIPADILQFYLPLMIVMTILFSVMANNRKITRWEGYALLIFYVWYLGQIIESAINE
ncbi:MAG: calcium/sodium antiporter [Bacteroidota bacterium]